jgi:hypothetical protein
MNRIEYPHLYDFLHRLENESRRKRENKQLREEYGISIGLANGESISISHERKDGADP